MLLHATACYCVLLHALLHAPACYYMLYCMLLRATTCSTACYCTLYYGRHPPGTRHERVPAEFWRSDSDSPPGNPAFQGTRTGSTGYPVPATGYPDMFRRYGQAGLKSGGWGSHRLLIAERTASVKWYQALRASAGSCLRFSLKMGVAVLSSSSFGGQNP